MKNSKTIILFTLLGMASLVYGETIESKGNLIEPLESGEELNQERLKLVREAEKFIYVKTFIINRDPSEAPVYEALCEKAQAGVDVRMLVDDIGRRQGGNPIKKKKGPFSITWFKSCGVKFERYAKPSWGPIDFALYNQHDKLIVSERAGIMGGTNFSRDYSAHAQFSRNWYDFDIAIQGPGICSLQKIFTMSWWRAYQQEFVGINSLSGQRRRARLEERFSPRTLNEQCHQLEAVGKSEITLIYNDPLFSKERPFEDYIISSVDAVMKEDVEKSVNLYAPYFIPNKKVMAKLIAAAKAGVKVRIITNSKTSIDPEAFPAYVAMLMRVKPLLFNGVEIYFWNPASFNRSALSKDNVFHKKGGCFSSLNCFVGSHNLDVRGDRYSSELIAVLTSKEDVLERNASFEDDMNYTIPLTEEDRRELLRDSKITDKIIAKIAGWAM